MQRFYFVILVAIVALYGSARAFATHPEAYYPDAPSAHAPGHTADYATGYASVPHIGLLLPLQSASFGPAAETVKEGFVAAAGRESALPLAVRVYSTTDDPLDVLVTYHQALQAGAVLIVGPLTRNGVTAVASSHTIAVPTLALNSTDTSMPLPPNLFLFGMQMEAEASHIAGLALDSNDMLRKHAIIIKDAGGLSSRLQSAFASRWLNEFGNTAESVEYEDDQGFFSQLRRHTSGAENVVFLALDANKVRRVRAFLSPEVPVYATSQVFVSNADPLYFNELDGIRFMDMPWLLQPDHPAVMAYRGLHQGKDKDTERLFALGIDAFRLMSRLLYARSPDEVALDGVTGYIRYAPPAQFIREPVAARFDKGGVQILSVPAIR
ncbi:MAG: penicillin-binding protein activator [Nitrosomonas sp.]|nr:penicillin-binding protein activator [Nitrosomonas sp.]